MFLLAVDWTVVGSLATAAATAVAVVALIVTIWFSGQQARELATSLQTQTLALQTQTLALQTQTFLSVLERARQIQLSATLDYIRSLACDSYDQFLASASSDDQHRVREAIDFFNDLEHLVLHGMLAGGTVMAIYFPSILSCHDRLLPWWVEGFRRRQGSDYFYEAFERLCVDTKAYGIRAGWLPVSP